MDNEDERSERDVGENRENWDDRANVHFNGGYGDIDSIIDQPALANPVVRRDFEVLKPHLPNGSVQRLLHLQCHIGTDTLSWAKLGAREVCGLDFSATSLAYARDIAERAGRDITYVEADAREAAAALPGRRFDVIVTSAGTVTWLPALDDWARSIATLLAPGGVFMIRDNHPLLYALDNEGLTITMDYRSGAENSYDTDETYTVNEDGSLPQSDKRKGDGEPTITHIHNHNWAHDFAEMTSVLIDAGLVIESLGEHDETDWKSLPMLEYDARRESWRMPEGYPRIPLTFSIVARKPKSMR